MTDFVGTAATPAVYELAEGVLWDDRAELVRWVDIWAGRVLAGKLESDRIVDVTAREMGQTAGAVALAEDGGLLVAGARGLVTISAAGEVSYGPDLLGERSGVRFNDGTVDPQGRFVVGTLSHTGKSAQDVGLEQLLRLSADGRVENLREGVRLSNGIAFSPDGDVIYHVDTFAGTVSSHSYSPGSFAIDEPWVTVLSNLPAYPDGLTVDAEGMLWVAQFGGSSVRRHTPAGELLSVVTVDAGQVTCPAFLGPALDRLAITTGSEGLASVTDQTGAIFLADAGIRGLPANRWAGSTTEPYWLLAQDEEPMIRQTAN